jgi:hypothetical protein
LINFGVLYHIKNLEEHIKSFINYDYVILETEVMDSEEIEIIEVDENGYDQAFNGGGIRPSQKLIEKFLSENNFEYKIVKDSILNSGFHIYDWESYNTKNFESGLRRFWICWKKELINPCKL